MERCKIEAGYSASPKFCLVNYCREPVDGLA
jgi:hypothetical protein